MGAMRIDRDPKELTPTELTKLLREYFNRATPLVAELMARGYDVDLRARLAKDIDKVVEIKLPVLASATRRIAELPHVREHI